MSKRKNVSYVNRRKESRRLRNKIRFLILCEGEKTEKFYFQQYKSDSLIVKVEGVGLQTVQLMKKAIYKKNAYSKIEQFDQVWVIMDTDGCPPNQIQQALHLAKKEGIQVAYSNEAFELWYLLHFDYHTTALSRHSYQQRVSQKIKQLYRKNNPYMYDILLPNREKAIKNAERLLNSYPMLNPARDNPSTTVHLLVKALLGRKD